MGYAVRDSQAKSLATAPPRLGALLRWRRLIMTVVGILVGVITLYLATRDIALVEIAAVFGRMDLGWVAFSMLMYAFSLPIRGLRWWVLLRELSAQRWPVVLEATIAGFAANYVLPARIGELFRADYVKRVSGLPRTAAVGTIGVERTLDGLTVLALLVFGALVLGTGATLGQSLARSIMIIGFLVFGGLTFLQAVAYQRLLPQTRAICRNLF